MTLRTKLAGCALVSFLCVGCGGNDYVESRYDDLAAASEAGAVAHGWVPSFLPASATAIRETHNLDTNEVWMTFSMVQNAFDGVDACERSDDILLPRDSGLAWWPEGLSEGTEPEQLGASRYAFYRCGNAAFVAVNDGRGFFWLRN